MTFSGAGPLKNITQSSQSVDTLRRGGQRSERDAPVRAVVLDSKVVLGSSRVVRGREEDTALDALVLSDDVARGRGRQDRVVPDDELADAVSSSDAGDGLDGLAGEESTVTSDDERLALGAGGDGREGGLDEVLGVVLCVRGKSSKESRWSGGRCLEQGDGGRRSERASLEREASSKGKTLLL